jgi:hypothetical protein
MVADRLVSAARIQMEMNRALFEDAVRFRAATGTKGGGVVGRMRVAVGQIEPFMQRKGGYVGLSKR